MADSLHAVELMANDPALQVHAAAATEEGGE